ncbi:MAG: EutN/CcmL family microcompartment protein [Bryobacterales bacterium]|nr:EutN/CcmL family microcompartment protein [Bryobacterales bacterium]
MQLGRVIGRVWSTVKDSNLQAQRLLVIQPVTPELNNTGKPLICTDAVGAGAGEIIYWCRGKESSFPFLPTEVPTDNTVVAIVDELHVDRNKRTE